MLSPRTLFALMGTTAHIPKGHVRREKSIVPIIKSAPRTRSVSAGNARQKSAITITIVKGIMNAFGQEYVGHITAVAVVVIMTARTVTGCA